MIVIATYNGNDKLKNLLFDINSFDIPNNEVCVVDNKSSNLEHLQYLKELEFKNYNVLYNSKNTFELGAYVYALDNIKAEVWFWLQDSIRLKYNIFKEITPKLTDHNIYTLLTFKANIYDDINDRTFLLVNFGTLKYSKGVAAISLFALDSVIQQIRGDFKLTRNKEESNAMNRGIAVILDRHNIEINELGIYEPEKYYDPDGYPFFKKQI